MSDAIDTSSLINDYMEDARAHLDALDAALLGIERDFETAGLDHDLVNDLLGPLHTLKGNSGMMGFATIQQFVHQLEGVFKRLLENPSQLNQALLNALFESATLLRAVAEEVAANPLPDISQETSFLESLASARGRDKEKKNKTLRSIRLTSVNENPPLSPFSKGGRIGYSPPLAKGGEGGFTGEKPSHISSAPVRSNVLKVDFERLDQLLNLTGELVMHKTKLNQIVKNIEEIAGDQEFFDELANAVQLVEKTAGYLQEAIMQVRMLPIRQVFQRFPRLVRDLTKQKGKETALTLSGENTEIDKTVIDALGDPLLHLIRNSVDHGIEPPGARAAAGKSREGTIHLSAKQESGHIVISVKDDGAGMNAGRIRQKAFEKGLISIDQVLTEDEIYNLVFLPGFSTAETVSETSGRGVGLDVVRKAIADFNGIIEVKSAAGQGTEFILKMPLTLAIIPALLVEASGELFAVPLTAVLESVKIKASDIHLADGREVVQMRGSVLSVKRLSRLLGLPDTDRKFYYMVVLGRSEKRMGLLVDRLRGQQEVVIKALDDYLGDAFGVSGATIMGDGRVVLIVDTARVMG